MSYQEISKEIQEIEVKSLQIIKLLPENLRKYVLTYQEVYDDPIEKQICMVLEKAKNSLLKEINLRRNQNFNNFSEKEMCYMTTCALLGLASIEAVGISNRDIKPANLLIMKDGSLKIADFGCAKKMKHEIQEHTLEIGTPQYWAPESIKEFIQIQQQNDDSNWNDKQITKKDFSKAELFNIGQCMLQAANLQGPVQCDLRSLSIKSLQNYQEQREMHHDMLISLSQSLYSIKFVNILKRMVEQDYEKRPSIRDCIQDLISLQEWG